VTRRRSENNGIFLLSKQISDALFHYKRSTASPASHANNTKSRSLRDLKSTRVPEVDSLAAISISATHLFTLFNSRASDILAQVLECSRSRHPQKPCVENFESHSHDPQAVGSFFVHIFCTHSK
jgi:hypothetical protein